MSSGVTPRPLTDGAGPGTSTGTSGFVAGCAALAASTRFQFLILGVILANGVTIGLETYDGLDDRYGAAFDALDRVFLAIFAVELAIRIAAHGRRPWNFFRSGWNVFDLTVVLLSVMPGVGANVTLLRIIRVLRVVRLIEVVEDLRVIVKGVGRSIAPLVGVGTLTVVLVYLYAVVGHALFGEELPEDWGTAGSAMFSCFRILTLDNWDGLFFAANEVSGWAVVYFLSFILLATFLVMNIIIAVVVNSVEEARRIELAGNADKVAETTAAETPELAERIVAMRTALDELERSLRVDPDGRGGRPAAGDGDGPVAVDAAGPPTS